MLRDSAWWRSWSSFFPRLWFIFFTFAGALTTIASPAFTTWLFPQRLPSTQSVLSTPPPAHKPDWWRVTANLTSFSPMKAFYMLPSLLDPFLLLLFRLEFITESLLLWSCATVTKGLFFNWSIIALRRYVSFGCTTLWISYKYICI